MSLRFRQVHLDFHTSGGIPGVGSAFSKTEFQQTLTEAAVDSITCFSVCHHGYSYHPTQVGRMHPSLGFDLLRAEIDAAHEVGVAVPVYISAGGNETAAVEHPEWREVAAPGVEPWGVRDNLHPGFHKLCFNTGYLDYLCRLVEEAAALYPDADGMFFDIVLQRQCCCQKCVGDMLAAGMAPENPENRKEFSKRVLLRYYEAVNAAARKGAPAMQVFHNSGHLALDRLELLKYFSHLELESLPTGGWGYDNFPKTAAFARKTGLDFLGMTGKFHSSWGEFGGLKHLNALRYECAAMIAFGAKCSVGDQMHPCGKLDKSTYDSIGKAYREVKTKEPFCENAVNLADVALISSEACGSGLADSDIGASRILLEGHFLFDMLPPTAALDGYKLVILPDDVATDRSLAFRLKEYVARGGRLLACGESSRGLDLDFGASLGGLAEFSPTYLLPSAPFRPDFISTPFVVYGENIELTVETGESLGDVHYPYFNRAIGSFCSHRQTPNRLEPSGFSCGVVKGNLAAMAHQVFTLYRNDGAVALRHFLCKVIARLLGDDVTVADNMPSAARITVTDDKKAKRRLVHLLYAPCVKRGRGIEILEDLPPLCDINVSLKMAEEVKAVVNEPEGEAIPFVHAHGRLGFSIGKFNCHRMVAVYYQ